MKKLTITLALVLAMTPIAASVVLALPTVGCTTGAPGPSTCRGTHRAEFIVGIRGNTRILALGGNDRVRGANNAEIIKGGAGRDTLNGRGGNDTIRSVDDATRDVVRCGPGRDRAHADWEDKLVACEVELRYDTF